MQKSMSYPNLFLEICRLVHIFAHTMAIERKNKGVISVRPPEGSDMKDRLILLAKKTERSINYWSVKAIEELLKKEKIKTNNK